MDLLNIITSSDKRKRLLLLLNDAPKTMEDIKEILQVTTTGMLPQIRILEERNLVKQDNKHYCLTELGCVVAAYLDDLVKTLETIEKEESFWKEHDLGAIPTPLLMKINELSDIQIAENSVEQLYEPHKVFLDNVMRCKKFSGISPIVHPVYPEMFLQLAKNGIEVSLILTKNAFTVVKNNYGDELTKFLRFDNANLYVLQENIKLSCIVADTYFSISLFYKNGVFDSRNDLVGTDTSTLSWGDELFNYYRERAEKIKYL